MYAILQTGGKQYRVQEGDVLYIEKLTAEEGADVSFEQVMLVEKDGQVTVGSPFVTGAAVTGKVVKHGKGKKIIVFKYKAKKNYRRKQGHRQPFTQVQITGIQA
ncbi:50S ribosomal protein L21 [Fodinisporobacter ferrooxydans]|uniref:Large ribosomal subunit protein bL21 n=1 Tax=Fodinisporobacter ferrooxydans TaxID=2901836 RepID=A0ABY4CIM1_9BACL|nr:50S ribosomal protein L21 [Alicyclobacillaceae bacterium MYW30-H2]